jgi:hypothetical protein
MPQTDGNLLGWPERQLSAGSSVVDPLSHCTEVAVPRVGMPNRLPAAVPQRLPLQQPGVILFGLLPLLVRVDLQ